MYEMWHALEDDPYVFHSERQEDDIIKEIDEVEPRYLLSPLLNHVGIIDLNNAWEQLSGPMQEQLAKSAALGGYALVWSVRNFLEDAVCDRLDFEGGMVGIENILTAFYPVVEDSLIGALANTRLWSRALGIPQLGWSENYPLNSTHSRGSHEFVAAITIVRVLQVLHDKDAVALAARLRADFKDEDFYDETMTDMEVCLLAAKLGALTGMSHDTFTPAGGDMMKRVMGMDEEEGLNALLSSSNPDIEEYLDVIRSYEMDERHVAFIIKCVQGKSDSLIGDLIHAKEGDCLEQDRLAYTFQDLQMCGVLNGPIARSLFDDSAVVAFDDALKASWQQAKRLLEDESVRVTHSLPLESSAPTITLLDPLNDYMLDAEGRLVNTRPDIMAWLAAYRAMMQVAHYQGPKLQGQEHEMAYSLTELLRQGRAGNILNDENLLKITHDELIRQLRTIDDPELQALLDANDKWVYPHNYPWELVPIDKEVPNAWFSVPIKRIKAGLDTLVMDDGCVKRLGDYVKDHPEATTSILLSSVESEYAGKKRIMRGVKYV